MLHAARPGGLVIVGVPHVPSALTRIPNFLFNAPPNHLTWWTQKALAAIAESQGAAVESIEQVPWGQNDSLIYWMERCAPIRCGDIHYKNAWSWYAAALISYLGGRIAFKVRGVPKTTDEGGGLLMVARRQKRDERTLLHLQLSARCPLWSRTFSPRANLVRFTPKNGHSMSALPGPADAMRRANVPTR
jgi:hypothetical protein